MSRTCICQNGGIMTSDSDRKSVSVRIEDRNIRTDFIKTGSNEDAHSRSVSLPVYFCPFCGRKLSDDIYRPGQEFVIGYSSIDPDWPRIVPDDARY